MKNTFAKFTNQFAISKTLRFELKPVGNTQKMLDENNIFNEDKKIKRKYDQTKPFFDKLHREFIKESLKDVYLSNISDYFEIYKKWKNATKENKKNLEKDLKKKESQLRQEVVNFFNSQAKELSKKYKDLGFKIKKENTEILFEENIFAILKEKYGKEEGSFLKDKNDDFVFDEKGERISIFDSWKGFTGYFTKFYETRKNFYKSDGTSTALATRIIDQNLRRFCDNVIIFEKIKDKLSFSEVESYFGKTSEEIFDISFYDKCFLQEGIDVYNDVLGGKTIEKTGEKIKGFNEIINLHKQQTGEKFPFFKPLDKQIASEKKESFFDDGIESDAELLETLKNLQKNAKEKVDKISKLFFDFVENNADYNLSKIYFSKEAFNTISRKWTSETYFFEKNLFEVFKKDKLVKNSDKKDDSYKFPAFISLFHIKSALENEKFEGNFWKEKYYEIPNFSKKEIWQQFLIVFIFEFSSLLEQERINEKGEKQIFGYDVCDKKITELFKNFEVNKDSKVVIKNFADSVLSIYQMAKYFAVEKKRNWIEEYELDDFYTKPDFGYLTFYKNSYEEIVKVYNFLRNYLTKKPHSEDKWKLNFENPTLANGWDKNKESDNSAIILRKDGNYFLGVMKKGCNKIFSQKNESEFLDLSSGEICEKMIYKYFPDKAKMFPKVCFSKKGIGFFKPSDEIMRIYKNAEFKKGDTFSVKSMQKLIDFYKDSLKKYEGWKCYDFKHLKPTELYEGNIGEFFKDVSEDGYRADFQEISEKYIQEKNENGELFLFQIKNKDWNFGKKENSTKNLYTIYFENLFSNENKEASFPLALNGQAEIFYRPKTEEKYLGYREDEEGNSRTFIDKRDGNKEKKIIKNRRYNQNKIFFHFSVTLNRGKDNFYNYNSRVNEFLANNQDINIIGIDRGEKHLAYYSVINQKAEVLESGSLNFVGKGVDGKEIDYHEKLENKAKERENSRKDWQMVEGIKDLKKGYISQVVRKLADLIVKYNAIIVFEDLNMRFKQIRGGIEKSIYQQLEKALIDKLNFLVNKKEIDSKKAGHLLAAYQLTAPFSTFKEMGKQTGVIFYTTADYTSKIDPVSGWRPNLYLRKGNAEFNKKNILNFLKIEFIKDRFEFTYNLKDFAQSKDIQFPNKIEWTVCSCVERFRWDKTLNNNKGGYHYYENLTKDFKELFQNFKIDICGNILKQIESLDDKDKKNARFFSDFIFLFRLVCQIRNTDGKIQEKINCYKKDGKYSQIVKKEIFDVDFILSPVEPFFDSRKAEKFGKFLPKNGDENGAYNIARKGLMILAKINDWKNENENLEKSGKKTIKYPNLFISNREWDDFTASFKINR